MELQVSDAREIVSELSKLLGKRLNIMDSRGFIIASSDPGRIGNFHAGAYQIIEENLESLEIKDGESWEGAVAGQNFPIRLDGHIIGVVGITGNAEDTRKYGSIIRKMTEILVLGKSREEALFRQQTERTLYLTDWMNISGGDIADAFIARGKKLGIKITVPHRIIAVYFEHGDSLSAAEAEQIIRTAAAQYFPDSICFATSDYQTVICRDISDEEIRPAVLKMMEKAEKNKIRLYMGIAPAEHDYLKVHENFICAQKALMVSRRRNEPNKVFYRDLGIELISDTVPAKIKKEFFEKVFNNVKAETLKDTIELLSLFYRENGSLKITAAQLHMHPNTLEYRLNKIFLITGYDPRRYEDACLFEIALSFYNEYPNFSNLT